MWGERSEHFSLLIVLYFNIFSIQCVIHIVMCTVIYYLFYVTSSCEICHYAHCFSTEKYELKSFVLLRVKLVYYFSLLPDDPVKMSTTFNLCSW